MEAAKAGGTACAALNGANESAVNAYLDGQLEFQDIPRIIEAVLEHHSVIAHPRLDEILEADRWAKAVAQESIASCSRS